MRCFAKAFIVVFYLLALPACVVSEQQELATIDHVEVEPTPSFVLDLWPEPGSVTALERYRQSNNVYGSPPSSVCVDFDETPFLEVGDFLSTEELLSRFSLEIDGAEIDEPDYIFMRDTEGADYRDPETGEVLFRNPPGGPFILCFVSELDIGRHTVTFVGSKTSGEELGYSWSFLLVEE